ncbi:hypothetical protein L211DRAFT_33523 [Terfezia boudieri ATCC MYA-4762]|uniref:Uncharacterized protein n=1 Tax=Terfezia boudieri ATCC MYA-4762 TaxID=1051890 RepID=A0A3N4M3D1_9PEZI|nr:hypothetical protein L211DRAFT_33523 [Terfezia boudieri ATCC MYA-4762]
MTSLPYDEQYTDHTHSLCLYRLQRTFKEMLLTLVIYNYQSNGITKLNSWEVVKGLLPDAMVTVEFDLKAQGFKSHDPPDLPVPRPTTLVSAGGITFCDAEGNRVPVQRHVGVMGMKATLEDNISVLNKGFTRGHNMTREEGWTVVKALLGEAEAIIEDEVEVLRAQGKREG